MTDLPPLPKKDWLLVRVGPSRAAWDRSERPAHVERAGPGEESVWDYPRPPEAICVHTTTDFVQFLQTFIKVIAAYL